MAGHSKFANIKHRKGAQDAKRAKLFTKLQREITVAAKTGQPDPNFNPRLRSAIIEARSQNMPKDRIDGAIKKATSGSEGTNFEEIRYEAYGPYGIAFIVEALTDNRNRTAGEIRSIFTKSGGNLGETGSVSFMFDHIGLIEFPLNVANEDNIFDVAIEFGAEEVENDKSKYSIYCNTDDFSNVNNALIEKFGEPQFARLVWKPKDPAMLDVQQAEKIMKLTDSLEDNDDVQNVTGNYDVPDEVLEKL